MTVRLHKFNTSKKTVDEGNGLAISPHFFMIIRKSTAKDNEFLVSAMQQLFALHDKENPTHYPQPTELPIGSYFIAEEEKPIGFIRGTFSLPTSIIYDIFVIPKYKNQKIEFHLYLKFKEIAKEKNVSHIVLFADIHDKKEQDFWHEQGFSNFQIKMITDL